jgi:hypothetical protein
VLRAEGEAREELRKGAVANLGHAGERNSIQCQSAVGVAHGQCHVEEFEVVMLMREPVDLIAGLCGQAHVVESDGPQMRACGHREISLSLR